MIVTPVVMVVLSSLVALSHGEGCPSSPHPVCASGMTCCLLPSGGEGCCPYVNATCCADRVHCCPLGSTCAKEAGGLGGHCRSEQVELASFIPAKRLKRRQHMKLLTSAVRRVNVTNEDCNDGSQCPDDSTCCPLGGGSFGCCPLKEAVCCADKLHCCPHGSLCDEGGYCKQAVSDKYSVNKWHIKVKKVATACPGGKEQCPTDTTCCPIGSGDYGCCPMQNAECCSDLKHCCPTGYRCIGAQCAKKKHVFLP